MSETLKGSLYALCTMIIWSGWNIVSRLGATESLLPPDIVFLRFVVAGVVAIPFVWHYRNALRAARPFLLICMVVGAGAPYVWLASIGFYHAPAAHGVLVPGSMSLWVALICLLMLKERFSVVRLVGYGVILFTILWRVSSHAQEEGALLLADGYFLAAGFVLALYTLCSKASGVPPLAGVAFVSFASLLGFCLPYAAIYHEHIATLPTQGCLIQLVYQGVIVSFVALVCYNSAMIRLGAARTSAFAALIPLLAMLLAIPVLHEYPSMQDVIFAVLLSAGVLLATGLVRPSVRFRAAGAASGLPE